MIAFSICTVRTWTNIARNSPAFYSWNMFNAVEIIITTPRDLPNCKAHNADPLVVRTNGASPKGWIIAEGLWGDFWYTSLVLTREFQNLTYTGRSVLPSMRNGFPLPLYMAEVHIMWFLMDGWIWWRAKSYSSLLFGAVNLLPFGQALTASS